MYSTIRLLSFIFVLGLCAACGSSSKEFSVDGGADTDDGSVDIDDLSALLAGAYCDLFERCAGSLFDVWMLEDCEQLTERRIYESSFSTLFEAVETGRVLYDEEMVDDCLADFASLPCDEAENASIDSCEQVLKGTAAEGENCSLDVECVGEMFCDFEEQCPGVCTPKRSAGQQCGDDDECRPGLTCSEVTELCTEPISPGDSCGGGVEPDCPLGTLCVGEDEETGTAGICLEPDEIFTGAEDDTCSPDTNWCEEGLACVLTGFVGSEPTWSCLKRATSGGICGMGIPNQCPSGEYCDITETDIVNGVFEKTCQPLPGQGEPCATSYPPCEAFHRCDETTGTCGQLRTLGQTCTFDDQCYSENCFEGGCRPSSACVPDRH